MLLLYISFSCHQPRHIALVPFYPWNIYANKYNTKKSNSFLFHDKVSVLVGEINRSSLRHRWVVLVMLYSVWRCLCFYLASITMTFQLAIKLLQYLDNRLSLPCETEKNNEKLSKFTQNHMFIFFPLDNTIAHPIIWSLHALLISLSKK